MKILALSPHPCETVGWEGAGLKLVRRLKSHIQSRMKSQRGQASIMIALMTLTFVFFFSFVVTTGILVSAKINLQNAADLAAYAGASVQARQLNQISFLNYEMRRQYKKFLFRYYILGTKAYAPEKAPRGERYWSLSGNPNRAFHVPSVCVTFNSKSNHCQVDELKPIRKFPINPLDSISRVLSEQLSQLEEIRKQQCGLSWFTNQMLLSLWLFNTDPTLEGLRERLKSGDVDTQLVLETLRSLGKGLGLIPKLAILNQRAKSLEGYVNAPALTRADLERINELKGNRAGVDPAMNERAIQAFLSAYYTLGSGGENDSFPGGQIQLTELLPPSPTSTGAGLMQLNTIETGFEAYFTYFGEDPATGSCVPRPVPYRMSQIPVGVYKDPKLLTYYAVRLDAEANLLFRKTMFPGLPFRLHLRAYAAAQPFGSRIGPSPPEAGEAAWRKDGRGPLTGSVFSCGGASCFGPPNLRLLERSSGGGAGDYWDPQVVRSFQASIQESGGRIQLDDDSYYNAMAPNPVEVGKYNILNDFPGDRLSASAGNPMVRYFPASVADSVNGLPVYSFRAPIVPPGVPQDQAERVIKAMVESSMGSLSSDSAVGVVGPRIESLKRELVQGITEYISVLGGQGRGEEGEGNFIARLRSPFLGKQAGSAWTPILGVPGLGIPEIAQINVSASGASSTLNNSWITQKNSAIEQSGRLGYSVKFIAFQTLLSGAGMTTNRTDSWVNGAPAADSETLEDLSALKH